jgi:hypothetical protein
VRRVEVLFLLCAGACASTRARGPRIDAAVADHPDALVQVRRSGCVSGDCPIYGFAVSIGGDVLYHGGARVSVLDERTGKVPEANIAALVSDFEKIDFIDTPEHCCDCPSDPDDRHASKIVIDYRPGGVQKEILIDEKCTSAPQDVRDLEAQIESLAGVSAWVGSLGTQTAAAGTTSP